MGVFHFSYARNPCEGSVRDFKPKESSSGSNYSEARPHATFARMVPTHLKHTQLIFASTGCALRG
jgi:hypothetical protein